MNTEPLLRSRSTLRLTTGPPLGLTCTVEARGPEVECRINRVPGHGGATSRVRWRADGSEKTVLGGGTQQEQRLSLDVAHRLARRARTVVTCTVQLGEDAEGPLHTRLEEELRRLAEQVAVQLEERRLRAAITAPGELSARVLSPDEELEAQVDGFLQAPLDELRARHRAAIAASQATHFHGRVLLFAPLYLASACLNDCSYCGFRRSVRVERVKLDREAAVAEANALAAVGHRTVDLVTGEIPTDAFVDYVVDVVASILARTPIRRLQLNLGALSEEQLRRLREAGATGYHLYQETYDPEVYLDAHGRGPKRDMANRIDASARALRAGFEAIGLGFLLGLGPVRHDLVRLVRHARELRREHPRVRLGFSLPRIQEAGQRPGLVDDLHVDDATFIKALLFLRLEFPDAHLTLTTREAPELRDSLFDLGITKLSAGVSTAPGGYVQPGRGASRQFDVRDQRSPGEVVARVRAAGLTPVFA